jgi:hypothetical protein
MAEGRHPRRPNLDNFISTFSGPLAQWQSIRLLTDRFSVRIRGGPWRPERGVLRQHLERKTPRGSFPVTGSIPVHSISGLEARPVPTYWGHFPKCPPDAPPAPPAAYDRFMVKRATDARRTNLDNLYSSWSYRLAVRSPPFQGGSTGSNPVGTIGVKLNGLGQGGHPTQFLDKTRGLGTPALWCLGEVPS